MSAVLAMLPMSPATAEEQGSPAIEINAHPISRFRIGSGETRFGPLEFVGGLELSSPAGDFGSMSAIRFVDGGQRFVGVTDTGFWYGGTIVRDAAGKPTGMSDFRMAPIRDARGRETDEKTDTDAEGLALRGSTATASFERAHRVTDYRIDGTGLPGQPVRDHALVVPRHELRRNKGFETVAYAPQSGPLKGARVVVSERSINPAGDIFAAIADGPHRGIFFVKRSDGFDVTDGAFLPAGDLLLLERHFSMARGVAMRLRRIPAADIRPGATVEGAIILTTNMSYQIDNMEGLDVWQDGEGTVFVSMVSDDNHSILQRNLYLEFRLVE